MPCFSRPSWPARRRGYGRARRQIAGGAAQVSDPLGGRTPAQGAGHLQGPARRLAVVHRIRDCITTGQRGRSCTGATATAIHWADDIYAGQVLQVPARPARIPRALAPSSRVCAEPAVRVAPAQATAGIQEPGQSRNASYSGGTPGGAFGACVVARESGGNAQIMNATGHYGLYQFSESTWVAYGGNAADFGHASVAEQNQVFANALAAGGESNWAPYDGC